MGPPSMSAHAPTVARETSLPREEPFHWKALTVIVSVPALHTWASTLQYVILAVWAVSPREKSRRHADISLPASHTNGTTLSAGYHATLTFLLSGS